ncbi:MULTISPECIES: amidohydrolase [unclassified Dyella]|uniref:amidohydrolase n=1 Tax=unclassified Dyella TaxID=2634549 RepID=UPI000C84B6E1|nr:MULTISPECIES: amidohydrolase [unclassified Dyella]MDR3444147.1 amidohydrolase [Dyella sp.]PMQ06406.1 N-substituted formamide deformylase [Dyella sp. AD56]
MKSFRLLIPGIALVFSAASVADNASIRGFPPPLQPADLVLLDATIVTLDPLQPHAQALAVRGGRIAALGSDDAIRHYVGAKTKVLDLHGAFVTPGFIEGHGHLMDTGEALMQVDVGKAANWDEIVAIVKAAVAKAKPSEWIIGQGWQQAKWNKVPQPNVDGLPLPTNLDAISPNNPVLLNHASGHGIYANAQALKLAGITDTTPDPAGGTIVRDAQGRAVGMLRDSAADPVFAAYDRYVTSLPATERAAHREHALQLAVQNEVSKGVTSFVDQGESFETVDWMKQQFAKGQPLRLYVYIDEKSVDKLDKHLVDYRIAGYADQHFTVLGLGEDVSDGALGTHSAWFLAPYNDAPGITGKNVTAMSDIAQMAKIAARDGFQMAIHAIGDRANRELLDLYQNVFTQYPAATALRWRIEHAQHLDPADIPRFAELGVIASMQSIHTCSDAPMVVPHLGEKRAQEGAYVWKTLIDSGVIVLDGTDTPVEDTNPIPNFYCGVTRAYGHGTKTFYPAQAKTRLQELQSYTWNNAYAVLQEHELGSLSPGKLADLDVFSGDLLTLPAEDILRTRVLYTIVGGKIVYQRPGADGWHKGQLFDAMPEFDHAE